MFRLVAIFGLVSLSSFAHPFIDELPSGFFRGPGVWYDNFGFSGNYTVGVGIFNDEMSVDYYGADGIRFYDFAFDFYDDGVFDVLFEDEVVGSGECDDRAFICSYEFEIGDSFGEEVLDFFYGGPGTLTKVGREAVHGRVISWEEHLTL